MRSGCRCRFSPSVTAWQKQVIPKTLIQKAIQSDEPIIFRGTGAQNALVQDQFIEYTYPIPKEEGGCQIHMIWTDSPCRITCWNDGHETELAMQQPEDRVHRCPASLAGKRLPLCRHHPAGQHLMEVDDIITNIRQGTQQPNIMIADKAIEPIGESKSDFEVVVEVAKKLGLEEKLTEGLSVFDLQKKVWEYMGGEKLVGWEQLKEKKYWMLQHGRRLGGRSSRVPALLRRPGEEQAADAVRKARVLLGAPGQRLPERQGAAADSEVDRKEPQSRRTPLQSPGQDVSAAAHVQPRSLAGARPVRRHHLDPRSADLQGRGPGRLQVRTLWLHPSEAEKRGIRNGDIVKIFNERGIVLAGAYVTERIRPGVAYIDHGARHDPIKTGEIERGGAINTISPGPGTSENCVGQRRPGYLVEVERVTGEEMDQWRRDYPEAFERKYDPAAGLRFDAWVVRGDKR